MSRRSERLFEVLGKIDLQQVYEAAPDRDEAAPGRQGGISQKDARRKQPMKKWKRVVLAVAVAALLVTVAAAAAPDLLERLAIQFFPRDSGKDGSYTVSGGPMAKYPLNAFSSELIAASEGREGPGASVSLMFDTWQEVKAFIGEDIPCVWPGGGENWAGWFQVMLFHTEYDVLWGVDIIGCDLEKNGAEVHVEIRTELWPYSGAHASYSIAEGSLKPLDSYTMANGATAEIVQYQGTEEQPGRRDCTGYFMREGILYRVEATHTVTAEGTEEHLKEILDSFP